MQILATIFACIVVGILGAIGFIYSGLYDVSATTPDNPIVGWALHTISDRSVNARLGGIVVPPGLDQPSAILQGGHLFAQNCVVCHGGPGLTVSDIAQGLNPEPPDLFRATRKPSMEEMFRFIKYGVKMTPMPGFEKTQTDNEIWQLAAFLRKAPGMTPGDFSTQTGVGVPAAALAKPASG